MTDALTTAAPGGRAEEVARQIDALRGLAGTPSRFWEGFLAAGAQMMSAGAAVLALRQEENRWKRVAAWTSAPDGAEGGIRLPGWEGTADACLESEGVCVRPGEPEGGVPAEGVFNVAVRLDLRPSPDTAVVVFRTGRASEAQARERLAGLILLTGQATVFQLSRLLEQAQADVGHFASVLDLVVLLNVETRFVSAAMTLCNELASRHRCDRVSLGWLDPPYVRVKAVSHIEKFERKMMVVQALEAAMEECLDQDEEIVWPPPADYRGVTHDHGRYASEQGVAHLASVPIRHADKPVAVLTAERRTPFGEGELRHLRLAADQAGRRLYELRRADRWFGARWAAAIRERAAKLLGAEHTGAKAAALAGMALLGWLVFGRMEYRIAAPFVLKSEDLAHLTAPFEGYIESVPVPLGAAVKSGEVLVALDTRELLLEEASALADQGRYQREAEKARAGGQLADMRIALAQAEQARVRLELVRRRLEQSRVRAPMDGWVVEGDLRERLGAAVKTGDLLMRVARLDRLVAEVSVDERDIEEVAPDGAGEILFTSRPDLRFPVRVIRIDPAALATEKGNVFRIRCAVPPPEPWWRPGMNGVAKIRAGRRSPLWLLTHRTADFLRLRFWW